MKKIAIVGGLAVLGVTVLVVGACGSDSDSLCEFQGTCGLSDGGGGVGDATTDGTAPGDSGPSTDAAREAGDATPPATCDFTVDPVEALCVTDALGIFVSSSGTASGAGTKESPVSTIGKGVALATIGKAHVYVCTGSYAENVLIGATQGVSISGGFDCGTWAYAGTNKVTVAPASGYALEVNQATSPVTIEDVEFDAAAGTPANVNSIAAFVNASPSLTLRRVALKAAAGGTPANPAAPATNHTSDPLTGHSAGASGPAGTACTATCGDKTMSTGGAGGDGNNGGVDAPGTGTPSLGAGAGGANNLSCNMNGANGGDGNPAPTASSNAPPSHAGLLTSTGWTPSAGASGSNGGPGQGGGGGGDKTSAGFGGGAACGGCGGAGGAAGAGGGASIALLAVSSPATLVECTLTSASAGDAATGTAGEGGQAGSELGGGGAATGGCTGGAGGAGSGGNGGGGGAGGVSFGLLFSGAAPTLDGVSASTSATHTGTTVGATGTAGGSSAAGGAATGGNAGNPGAAGPAGLAAAIQQYESLP